jgi:serine/threonine-protein kinase
MDFGSTEDGSQYIAMEMVVGRDLHQLLITEWPLEETRLARIIGQVLSALAEAHGAGVIHRDLKPENIMVENRRGEVDFVKVLDFGIAKIQEPAGESAPALTRAGFVCGTPEYMSPEQVRGVALDPRSDLYTVGVILYQLATGVLPFTAASAVALATKHLTERPMPPTRRRPDAKISPAMEQLILRALSKNPADRPQTALAFRAQLVAIERGEETGDWGLPPREPVSAGDGRPRIKSAERREYFSGLGTVLFKLITLMLLATSIGLVGYWFYLSRGAGLESFVPPPNAPVPGEK